MSESGRDEILNEIRRTARANDGKPLGRRRFEQETGITPYTWGRYWSRFGDAQREAGFEPNSLNTPFARDAIVERYIAVIRELGRIPTAAELRIQRSRDPEFPTPNTFARLGSKSQRVGAVLDHCGDKPEYDDVVALCSAVYRPTDAAGEEPPDANDSETRSGFVYLIKGHRGEYKLGHTSVVDRRLSELATGSSVELEVVHEIKTDDPLGIEAYWHRRFSERRIKNEWFKLSAADVRAFRRWRRIF